jgi:prepilin-type N-terminal cleavage/methylation domain-containing protein
MIVHGRFDMARTDPRPPRRKRRPAARRPAGRASRRRRAAGFSVVELLIAMVVMAIGLLGAAQMIPLAMAGVTQAGNRSRSVQLAQERLDDLMGSDFDSSALIAGTYSEAVDNTTIDWTIADDSPVPGTKRIDLTVSWQTSRGTRSSSFTTYLSGGR